ncbi:hypothetical protein [Thalassotalea sp. PS06]|uniref:hypothetical protein n=1 Tax=Thalassotalea sp. PS06 TaxID=2594005 RepID=UPI001163836F|nr:hypothetical protein [Thalassotalea sp. PS06]QDP01523.1 hypothetical protein FNC98_09355 [Thalassotalea sp. PS06]
MITDKGNANVNHGILYLDGADDAAILKHELMHLIGFIDEYPLPANHQVCQVNELTAVAKNIVVDSLPRTFFSSEQQARALVLAKLPWGSLIKNTTPITKIEAGKRVLGTPEAFSDEVGVFASQTCDKQNRMSYKPQQAWGLLRYNSLQLSEVYQRIHALNPGRFAMQRPPVI